MSEFDAARQAVFNLIAEHEDIDVLLQEVGIFTSFSRDQNVLYRWSELCCYLLIVFMLKQFTLLTFTDHYSGGRPYVTPVHGT